ncbi:MAG: replication-associated recombination protein A, partial [Actinomycetota bacterium]
QEHLVGKGKVIRRMIEQNTTYSIIFWGPPGSGKTTLARIIANSTDYKFISFSAVTSGIKQIKEVMEIAKYQMQQKSRKTILFIDEIHRFNKAQQDAFLPFVENGTIILIGATTENPSFEVNSALLSRCKVFILNKLKEEEIITLLKKAVSDKDRGLGKHNIQIDDNTLAVISRFADGDIRIAYNILELSLNSAEQADRVSIDTKLVENIIQKKTLMYDKSGEEHFNLISALHKSLRGSDPDAAVYWIVRMLEGGEDPLYIARRMVRFASEDIGLADNNALSVALSAKDSFHFLGPPEGYLALIQTAVYLALAPKSNSVYKAYKQARKDALEHEAAPVPYHIRNAPTKLMKEMGYGKGYKYAHDYEHGIVSQSYLPKELEGRKYYFPTDRGFEKNLKKRIEYIKSLKQKD